MEIVFTKNTVFGRDIFKAGDKAEFNEKEAKIILKAGVGEKFVEPEEPETPEEAVQPEPIPGTGFAVPLPEAAEAEAAETSEKPAPKTKGRAKNENV
ncbi:hypothetical protein [Parasutterella sp.]|uniref:hypothetical protein n=1 Tax=Parasutterella sp. TaxID=2049037 RepID=UPI003991186E